MLHVTNGDSAVDRLRAAGMEGDILPWRDVLHDGPVPAGMPLEALSRVRADFLAAAGRSDAEGVRRGFAARDRRLAACAGDGEVVLWFEHDLYDQLQLVQVLDWFADHPHPRLTLINPADYLGGALPDVLRALHAARAPVTDAQLALARWTWDAFRGRDPRHLETVMESDDVAELVHLRGAILRLLQEYPSVRDGLSRSERQALAEFAAGPCSLRQAWHRAHHGKEDAVWMGDTSFVALVHALAGGSAPLLEYEEDGGASRAFGLERRARITPAGDDVLAGRSDAVWMHGIDRWIGGVHLGGREVPWRWDDDQGCIVAAG